MDAFYNVTEILEINNQSPAVITTKIAGLTVTGTIALSVDSQGKPVTLILPRQSQDPLVTLLPSLPRTSAVASTTRRTSSPASKSSMSRPRDTPTSLPTETKTKTEFTDPIQTSSRIKITSTESHVSTRFQNTTTPAAKQTTKNQHNPIITATVSGSVIVGEGIITTISGHVELGILSTQITFIPVPGISIGVGVDGGGEFSQTGNPESGRPTAKSTQRSQQPSSQRTSQAISQTKSTQPTNRSSSRSVRSTSSVSSKPANKSSSTVSRTTQKSTQTSHGSTGTDHASSRVSSSRVSSQTSKTSTKTSGPSSSTARTADTEK